MAEAQGIDLSTLTGSGPGGRIVRADLARGARPRRHAWPRRQTAAPSPRACGHAGPIEQAIPHEDVKLSNIRKTIARRLTEAKQQVPHIYLTVDIHLDALLKLRGEFNAGLESRGVKLSVNDLLIKALAQALMEVPECNVAFAGDHISSTAAPTFRWRSRSRRAHHPDHRRRRDQERVGDLDRDEGARGPAKDGKLQPQRISGRHREPCNMGMYGIKQFEAVSTRPRA